MKGGRLRYKNDGGARGSYRLVQLRVLKFKITTVRIIAVRFWVRIVCDVSLVYVYFEENIVSLRKPKFFRA